MTDPTINSTTDTSPQTRTQQGPKIAVVGAGAIGGLIAGRLGLAGQPVTLLARGQALQVLREQGLTIEDAKTGQRQNTRLRVCATAAEAGPQDFIIVAVKSYSLGAAIASLAPMLAAHSRVVTAVNGLPWWFAAGLNRADLSLQVLDPDAALASALAPQQVVGCVVNCAASVPQPGLIRHATGNRLTLGSALRAADPAVNQLAQLLTGAGFELEVSGFIHQAYWKKLLGNITLNPIGALTLSNTAQMLDDPATAELALTVMQEVRALGLALGIDIGISAQERLDMTRALGKFRSSMLQDLELNKPLEIDGLFAAVLSLAQQTGTALPATTMLHTLARLRAQSSGQLPSGPAATYRTQP